MANDDDSAFSDAIASALPCASGGGAWDVVGVVTNKRVRRPFLERLAAAIGARSDATLVACSVRRGDHVRAMAAARGCMPGDLVSGAAAAHVYVDAFSLSPAEQRRLVCALVVAVDWSPSSSHQPRLWVGLAPGRYMDVRRAAHRAPQVCVTTYVLALVALASLGRDDTAHAAALAPRLAAATATLATGKPRAPRLVSLPRASAVLAVRHVRLPSIVDVLRVLVAAPALCDESASATMTRIDALSYALATLADPALPSYDAYHAAVRDARDTVARSVLGLFGIIK